MLIDYDQLSRFDAKAFRGSRPYPWLNPQGVLTTEAYQRLAETLPPLEQCEPFFGKQRKHGQRAHDRYRFEYQPGVEIAAPWQALIDELRGERYHRWMRHMLGTRFFRLSYHWHYTPNGCSVSPHCDSRGKLGSHIFYMNTRQDWQDSWGGETVVLEDGGRLSAQSAPDFEDFDAAYPAKTLENYSFLFCRRGDSWHGVREIQCPEGALRKAFIVVIENDGPRQMLKRLWKPKR